MNATVMMGLIDFFRSGSDNFRDTNDRTIYASGIHFAPCNGVIEKKETSLKKNDITLAIDFFASKKLPFVWWTGEKLLSAFGFQFGGTMTGIVLDVAENKFSSPTTKGLQIKIVGTQTELNAFTNIIANCFGFSPQVEQQYALVSRSAMERNEQIHFLAYLNETPVATATLSTLPKSAGIWNLATLPEYRKTGIGTALCHEAFIEAQKRKYTQLMAVLMPKGASGVFRNLGYKEVSSLPFYVYGMGANELEK